MSAILIKFEDNWADEMDLEGFCLTTKDAWTKVVEHYQEEYEGEFTASFGTNEENEYDSVDDFFSNFTVTEVSDEEAAVIKKLFGSCRFGTFPVIV